MNRKDLADRLHRAYMAVDRLRDKTWVAVVVGILIVVGMAVAISNPGSSRDGTVDAGVRAACTSYVVNRQAVDTQKARAGLAAAIEREASGGSNTAVIGAARKLVEAASVSGDPDKVMSEWVEAADLFAEACFAAGYTPR